ncbi:hypothetical protein [Luteococcus sp. OSA5]|uniref:hypothetical protein n=1 Tax=Luteococcus sp. OSA5 TaxID=3401630 RepID=UPI003B43A7B0
MDQHTWPALTDDDQASASLMGWLCVETRPTPHRALPTTETIHGCFPTRREAERSATARAAQNPGSQFRARPLLQYAAATGASDSRHANA